MCYCDIGVHVTKHYLEFGALRHGTGYLLVVIVEQFSSGNGSWRSALLVCYLSFLFNGFFFDELPHQYTSIDAKGSAFDNT